MFPFWSTKTAPAGARMKAMEKINHTIWTCKICILGTRPPSGAANQLDSPENTKSLPLATGMVNKSEIVSTYFWLAAVMAF